MPGLGAEILLSPPEDLVMLYSRPARVLRGRSDMLNNDSPAGFSREERSGAASFQIRQCR